MATPVPKKRGDKWTVIVDLPCGPGERKQKRLTARTKAEVEKLRDELLGQIRKGTYIQPSKQLLKDYLLSWIEQYDAAERTVESYKEIIDKHLIPKLGNYIISDLKPFDVQEYVREAKKNGRLDGRGGLSLRTVEYHITILRNALSQAVALQMVAFNPCIGVQVRSRAKNSTSMHSVHVLSPEEIDQILQRVKNTVLYLPVLLSAFTGMRLGETLGVRWKDINFKARTITIRQQVKKAGGTVKLGNLKTAGSIRTVTVDKKLIQILKSHKAQQAEKRLSLGERYNDLNLVCARPDGGPQNPGTISSRFRRTCKSLNLPASFHDLRHTHATLLLEAGIDANEIQARLGHHDVSFTLRAYCHKTPSMLYRAADTFEQIMNNKKPVEEQGHDGETMTVTKL